MRNMYRKPPTSIHIAANAYGETWLGVQVVPHAFALQRLLMMTLTVVQRIEDRPLEKLVFHVAPVCCKFRLHVREH